jgi:catechol 2,3-dioxygenase-like lactoylglutathione lyase family enzyme
MSGEDESMVEFKRMAPTFLVDDVDAAQEFYCGVLGFTQRSFYISAAEGKRDPGYLIVEWGGTEVHLSSFRGTRSGNGYLYVDDVDAYYA